MTIEPRPVGGRVLSGMFWAYSSYVGGRVLVLGSTALLARLLTPADFGIVALALVFIGFLEVLSDLGLTQALVIADESDARERANSVWTTSVAIGLALTVFVAALGPVAASFFDQPELVTLMPLLGANLFLRSLGSTHYALAQKALDFRTRTLAEFADAVIRGAAGIALALAGAGAYSLVVGYLIGTAAMTAALWILVPWRPTPRIHWHELSGMVGYGSALTGLNIIAAVLNGADDLIVGRVLGATALGFYSIGYRLPELLIINLSNVAGQVLFPAMATLDMDSLRSGFLRSLRFAAIVALPLTVGIAVLAEPLLLALFGDQWHGATRVMQVMALWTLMSPIAIVIGTAYKALGRADILLKLAIPQALTLVVGVLLLVDRGIVAVAALQAGIAVVSAFVAMIVARRMLGLELKLIGRAIAPPVLAAAVLGAGLLGVDRLGAAPVPTILIGVAVGLPLYFGALWVVARDSLRYLLATAAPGRFAAGPSAP